MHLFKVLKVYTIVKLCKFQDDFNGFRLVIPRETTVALAIKDTFAALKDKVRADWVL